MKTEFTLMDAAYNLIESAEINQKALAQVIQQIKSSSASFDARARSIDDTIHTAIAQSTQNAAVEIATQVSKDMSNANRLATQAADRIDEASRHSMLFFTLLQVSFFLTSVLVLWFIFMKDMPTREEYIALKNEVEELKAYGEVFDCNGKKCIQIEGDSGQVLRSNNAPLYFIKPRR